MSKPNKETAIGMPPPALIKSSKAKRNAIHSPVMPKFSDSRYIAAPQGGAGGWKRVLAIFDFILRICALVTALAAAATMGTTDQTLPFFNQFFQFQASYDDFPTFTSFFVVGNGIASAYLVLSLPFSIVGIVSPHAKGVKLLLLVFDTMLVAFTTAAAASAAAIVYLAHNGNSDTNWIAICNQFTGFCQRVSGAVVASFISAVIFVFLVVLSALTTNFNA